MKTYLILYFSLFALLLFACKSTQKLTEEGNYDEAIERALDKLVGKKKKKAEVVLALENAFAKANGRDMNEINDLRKENRAANWEEIFDLANAVKKRQKSIEPLLPLVDDRGRRADFTFVKINGLLQESKGKAASYLYHSAKSSLAQARVGDKAAARIAYEQLERIERYLSPYKDRRKLMNEARGLGVSHILFKMENDAYALLSRDFERAILRMDVQDLNELWREFHTRPKSGLNYDYEIVMKLDNIDVSPESVKERSFQEEAEIEEGEQSLRDEDGNVVKDSTGNIVKVPVVKVVTANVIEVYQSKAAIVGGTLFFYNKAKQELLDTQPINAEALFENYASTYQGDRRALSRETKDRIGNRPLPFPSDEALLLDAADVLKPVIKEKIARTRFF
ncbi:MAG: hypothetical protein AAF849_07865 [Bacteroidota bacterium]